MSVPLSPDRPPTEQQLIVLMVLHDLRGQRYVAPRTERQALGRIRDLAIAGERKPTVLPPGRCFGVKCPRCKAEPGQPCQDVRSGRPLKTAHAERRQRFADKQRGVRRQQRADRGWAERWSRQRPRGRK